MISNHARYFINDIPWGTAERIYAQDFGAYCEDLDKGTDTKRPNVEKYKLGVRVAEYIREEIDGSRA